MPETEQNNQTETLWCNTCKEGKPCSAFYKKRSSKRGYQWKCKECGKQYYQENADYIKQRNKEGREENAEYLKQGNKEGREENAEYIKEYNKEYNKENADYIKQRNKEYKEENAESISQGSKEGREENAESIKEYINTPFKSGNTSKRLEEIKIYEPYIIDSNNDVNFQCTYCGEYFKTTKRQIYSRLDAINGKCSDGAEHRLYCSEQCKDECPVYNQTLYTKDQVAGTSREVQPELRQMVLARDNYTCQKCNNHKDNLEVGLHCHHIWPTNEDPITSADIDTCMTVCADCHHGIHMNVPGCGYAELRCSIENKMII